MIDSRDLVFDRVEVDFLAKGGTRVTWSLFYQFAEPGPHSFRLQAGSTGAAGADDWADVGAPVVDGFQAVDPSPRSSGRDATTHYRVRLTTPAGAHTSRPAHVFGVLSRGDWLLAREVVRLERLRLREYAGASGWLYKRRRAGSIPPQSDQLAAVTDPLTGEVTNSRRPQTVGTEFLGGFFAPVPVELDLERSGLYAARADDLRGTVDDDGLVVKARAVAIPALAHNDVFVAAGSDRRYYVHRVRTAAELRSTPLVLDVELRVAPFSDVIYALARPS
jgi:hypothetical protein